MGYKIYYTPIIKDGHDGSYFQMNGATTTDREESIKIAKTHCAFQNKGTEIVRVDETKEFCYDTE